MNKGLIASSLVMFGLMVACSAESGAPAEGEADEVGTSESALIQCGPLCPPGTAQLGFACSTSCGGGCPNAVSCGALPPAQGWISASPETVTVGSSGVGTTRVCWSLHNITRPVWVRVRVNGAPGSLFTKESDNGTSCANAPWIQAGQRYDFTIRTSNDDTSYALANVVVRGVAGGGGTTGGGSDAGIRACEPGGSGVCAPGFDCHCGDRCVRVGSICQ